MVGFIEVLRCILCCLEYEEEDESALVRDYHRQHIPISIPPPPLPKFVVPRYQQQIPHLTTPLISNNNNNNSRGSSSSYFVSSSNYVNKQKPTPNPSFSVHTQTSPLTCNATSTKLQSDTTPLLNPPLQPKKQPQQQNQLPETTHSSLSHNNIDNYTRNRQLPTPSSSVSPQPSFKPPPLLSLSQPSSSKSLQNATVKKPEYVYSSHKEAAAPLYSVPEDFKELINKGIVPQLLRKPLAPSIYANYFAALLYAEDAYIEKWSNYCLRDVTLELHKATLYAKPSKNKNLIVSEEEDNKIFVAFRIDSIPERRPFLLSRDFVLLQPLDKTVLPFRGILYRVVKSNLVLAEFGDDFHQQHSSSCKYDVSFSFNRVCLKRCHQAVAAATDPSFLKNLFPEQKSRTNLLNPPRVIPSQRNINQKQVTAVYNISRLKGSPPFLVEGPLSVISTTKRLSSRRCVGEKGLSVTGLVIQEAVLQIYRTSPGCRILINAPTNSTCDVLMRSLRGVIPESEIFRANAAFREVDGVPYDILPLCPFKGECFTCPPLHELRRFKVVLSTYVSSFRLHNEGINMGHFSHIFLVDSSSTTEPETMVALANLADEETVVVVSGAIGSCSSWVRSNIARGFGLKISYFQRLLESEPYCNLDPMFVACIRDNGAEDFNNHLIKSKS